MEKVRATPAARKMAKDFSIELNLISGSGENGRIHKDDVLNFKNANSTKISPLALKIAKEYGIDYKNISGSGFNGKIMKIDILNALGKEEVKNEVKNIEVVKEEIKSENKPENNSDIEIIPMSAMRKVISKRMVDSAFTAPTFTLNYEVDMTEILALRQKLLNPILNKTGFKITVTDLISVAVIKNLMKPEHKFINSSLSEDGKDIIVHKYVNLAMAVGLDEGLLTPVVKNADKMGISEFVVALKTVIKKAQQMKLKPDELSGSTVTISNLGMFGVSSFNPIINQPNSVILGIAATVEKPVVINKEIVIRPIMQMCLTIDHRVVDGMNGAKFMQDLKNTIENPFELLI